MGLTGDRIRELRILHRLTLDDVARHLQVGRQAVYKYETGLVTNIPLDNLEKMASLFGTTPAYLAGWTDDTPGIPYALGDITKDEAALVSSYRSLSSKGKSLLIERSKELELLYGKKSEDHSAQLISP